MLGCTSNRLTKLSRINSFGVDQQPACDLLKPNLISKYPSTLHTHANNQKPGPKVELALSSVINLFL